MLNRHRARVTMAICLMCTSLGAQQADRAQTESLSQRAADRLNALHTEADTLATEERTLLGELRRLEVERQIRGEELSRVEREAGQIADELTRLDRQIASLEQQEATDAPRLRARLVSLYKLGQGRYVRVLLSATDVRQMVQAVRTVQALAGQDRSQVALHQKRLAELQASRTTVDERRARLATLRNEALRAQAAAAEAIRSRNALVEDIDHRRDLNAQLSGELQGAQQRLQATLAALTAGRATAGSSLPLPPFRGDLDWPATGSVRQRFGRDGRPGSLTNGIDIAAAEGAVVRAIHDGTVAFAGPFSGFGQLAIVDHGGNAFSLYGNMREVALATGAHVTRGEAVGKVGVSATGVAGLYFELRIDGRPVDPLQWLRKN